MRRTLAGLCLVQVLLTGCAGRHLAATQQPASAPAQTAPANPYLQDRPAVPVEAGLRFARAQDLIARQQWSDALQELLALAESDPQLSGVALDVALLYCQQGEKEQARLWFERSIASNSNNIAAYNEYGIFLRAGGQFAQAETVYLLALEQWEACADTHRNIGILYDLYLGEPQKALQHYRRYQQLIGTEDQEMAGWIADLERRQLSIAGKSGS